MENPRNTNPSKIDALQAAIARASERLGRKTTLTGELNSIDQRIADAKFALVRSEALNHPNPQERVKAHFIDDHELGDVGAEALNNVGHVLDAATAIATGAPSFFADIKSKAKFKAVDEDALAGFQKEIESSRLIKKLEDQAKFIESQRDKGLITPELAQEQLDSVAWELMNTDPYTVPEDDC